MENAGLYENWFHIDGPAFLSLVQIIFIDIAMSGDNAIIVGVAAGGLPAELRRRAILYGIAVAAVLRIIFAIFVVQLLQVIGLLLAGGLLLVWVCWRMWRELRDDQPEEAEVANVKVATTMKSAMINIVVADVTMSLDNVLAVAGAAKDHIGMLIFGLFLSVALMGAVANVVARLLQKHKWIGYVGLLIIAYVAGDMIYRGATQVHAEIVNNTTWFSEPTGVEHSTFPASQPGK